MRRSLLAIALLIFAASAPRGLQSQTEISARDATLRIGGRLHTQYWTSSVDGANSNFFVRRARLRMDASFTDFVTGKVQVDFAFSRATLLDAYIRLNFSDAFRLSFGQLKRAFDLFELSSSTDLSLVERTGAIAGYDTCTGVGRICSYSRMSERLLLGNRDTGIRADGAFGRFSYIATITNGTLPTIPDINDEKSFAGRVSFMATQDVQVSVDATAKDYLDPDDETAYAFAWGGDVQVGHWRDGFLLQAGVIGGENWESLDDVSRPGEFIAGQFVAGQVAASWYIPLESDRIIGLEPIARVSITDPDRTIDDDGGLLLTPGMMFYFLGKNKVGFNYDFYAPSTGDVVSTLRLATFLYF
jgi:Phosphate-selective porin O and P